MLIIIRIIKMSISPLFTVIDIILYTSAGLTLMALIFVLVMVNKRIPGSFGLIIFFYSLANISRAIIIDINFINNHIKTALTTSCVILIEISIAYFVF